MNGLGLTWVCHACGKLREDQWISVAHRKFVVAPEACPMQIRLNYCNDTPGCIAAVVKALDQLETRLREAFDETKTAP